MPTRRALRRVGTALAVLGAGAVGLVFGALAHLDLPATRRVVAWEVTKLLDGPFRGKVVVERVGALGPTGAHGVDARVVGAGGEDLIVARGVSARIDTLKLLRTITTGPTVSLPSVVVDDVAVRVDADPEFGVTLGSAFRPRVPDETPPSGPSTFRLEIPRAVFHHVAARGTVLSPPLDAELAPLVASVLVEGERVRIGVIEARGVSRSPGLPVADGQRPLRVRGLAGFLEVPPGEQGLAALVDADVEVDGDGGPLVAKAHAELTKGTHVAATATVDASALAHLRVFTPALAASPEPVHVAARAEGDLPALTVAADVTTRAARAHAEGKVVLAPDVKVDLDVRADDVDAAGLVEGAPPTKISARATLARRLDGTITVDGRVAEGEVANQRTPPLDVAVVVDTREIRARVAPQGRGVSGVATAALGRESGRARVDADLRVRELAALVPSTGVRGDARVVARGVVDTKTNRVEGHANVSSSALAVSDVRVYDGAVAVDVGGTLARPRADVSAKAAGVTLAATSGTPRALGRALAAGRVEADGGAVRVTGVTASLPEPDVSVTVARADIASGSLAVEGLVARGLGDPVRGDLTLQGDDLHVRLVGERIDLARVGEAARVALPAGELRVDADLEIGRRGVVGAARVEGTVPGRGEGTLVATAEPGRLRAELHVDAGEVGRIDVDDATATYPVGPLGARTFAEASLDVPVRARASVPDLLLALAPPAPPGAGRGAAKGGAKRAGAKGAGGGEGDDADDAPAPTGPTTRAKDLGVGPPPPSGEAAAGKPTERERDGTTDVGKARQARRAEAAELAAEEPALTEGDLALVARVTRGPHAGLPAVVASVTATGLRARVDGRLQPLPDGCVTLLADGTSGLVDVGVAGWDGHGSLVTASAKTRIDLAGLVAGAPVDLAALPVALRADVPARPFPTFPLASVAPSIAATVGAGVVVDGTVAAPVADVFVDVRNAGRGRGLGAGVRGEAVDAGAGRAISSVAARGRREGGGRGGRGRATRADARLSAHFEDDRALYDVRLTDDAGGQLVVGGAANVPYRGWLAGTADPAKEWTASAAVLVDHLDLGRVPFLRDRVKGILSGNVHLHDLHRQAGVTGLLRLEDAAVEGITLERVDASFSAGDGKGGVYVASTSKTAGTATLRASTDGLVWGAQLVPGIDKDARGRVDYDLRAFRLETLAPVVQGVLPELAGKLDGQGRIDVASSTPTFQGTIALSEGRAYLTSFGQDLEDVRGTIRFQRGGVVVLEGLSGDLGTGTLRGSGQAKLAGLRLVQAEARIKVARGEELPVSLEGVTVAELSGEFAARVVPSADGSTLDVLVDVPSATAILPTLGARTVQSLDPDPTVRFGVRREDGRIVRERIRRRAGAGGGGRRGAGGAKEEASTTRATLHVGKDVWVEGPGLRAGVTGKTVIEVADELSARGQIDLTGGYLEVQGRRFEVDHGSIVFDGDPSDPTVVAAAYWDAPDRTRVWVEFTGPVSSGKITLRSEPAHTPSEILTLLVTGTVEGDNRRNPRNSTGTQGAALAGGQLTGSLNRALDDLGGGIDVEAKVATGEQNNPRPQVAVRLRRNLVLEVGYNVGRLRPNRPPDRAILSLEWQFLPRWSAVATGGDAGSTLLDLLWQYRY